MATRNASFTRRWYDSYRKYYPKYWAYNSLIIPFDLAQNATDVNLEGRIFCRPIYSQTKMIFDQNYDWSTNRGLHLYKRYSRKRHNFKDIRTLNITLGSLARYVLFGNKELCDEWKCKEMCLFFAIFRIRIVFSRLHHNWVLDSSKYLTDFNSCYTRRRKYCAIKQRSYIEACLQNV